MVSGDVAGKLLTVRATLIEVMQVPSKAQERAAADAEHYDCGMYD
jgi:hypothetical protein